MQVVDDVKVVDDVQGHDDVQGVDDVQGWLRDFQLGVKSLLYRGSI